MPSTARCSSTETAKSPARRGRKGGRTRRCKLPLTAYLNGCDDLQSVGETDYRTDADPEVAFLKGDLARWTELAGQKPAMLLVIVRA